MGARGSVESLKGFLIWHGVDGGGDDGGRGRKWSWSEDAMEILAGGISDPGETSNVHDTKPDWSVKTRVIERQSSDLQVVVGSRPLAADCVWFETPQTSL